MSSGGPYSLVTVNKNPERASRIIARFLEQVKDSYNIQYVANSPTIEELREILKDKRPDVLFCASTWTPAESEKVIDIAKDTVPGIKTHVVPRGLVDQDGEDAMVEYLKSSIEGILTGGAKATI